MFETEKYAGRGYAPGNYCCICRTCNGQFIGDKGSWCCLGCAKSADRIEQLVAERDAAYKRGMEDAAKVVAELSLMAEAGYNVTIYSALAAIRAQIQED